MLSKVQSTHNGRRFRPGLIPHCIISTKSMSASLIILNGHLVYSYNPKKQSKGGYAIHFVGQSLHNQENYTVNIKLKLSRN